MALLRVLTATIANGASLSGAIDLRDGDAQGVPVAIQMPDGGSWTAANLTFQGSVDGATYETVYDKDGVEVTVQAAADRTIILDPSTLAGLVYLKVRSGTAAAPVNQASDRTIKLLVRRLV